MQGKFVDLETTIADFNTVLRGDCDDVPEGAFFMNGGLADALEKAKAMQ